MRNLLPRGRLEWLIMGLGLGAVGGYVFAVWWLA